MFQRIAVFGLLAVLTMAGCSKEPPLCKVTGTVTLDGAPLPEGQISFFEVEGKPTSDTGPIKNGAFDLSVKAGKKIVRIYAPQTAPGSNMSTESIPLKYNADSTLTADVAPGQPNSLTFTLQSK